MSRPGGDAGATEDLPERWIFLGASNLARDFPRVLDLARNGWGGAGGGGGAAPQAWVAAGHGRSYGTWSRVLVRALPGIVHCDLWPALEEARGLTPARHRMLITDIGNDLVYGATPAEIAGWVERCVERLQTGSLPGEPPRIGLTLLPLASLRTLGRWQFQVLRSVFFPLHFRGWRETLERAERLQGLLRDLARRRALGSVEPPADWYGPDRIHLRRGARREAWEELLRTWGSRLPGPTVDRPFSRLAWWRMTPRRWRLLGLERGRAQPAGQLADGTRVHVY